MSSLLFYVTSIEDKRDVERVKKVLPLFEKNKLDVVVDISLINSSVFKDVVEIINNCDFVENVTFNIQFPLFKRFIFDRYSKCEDFFNEYDVFVNIEKSKNKFIQYINNSKINLYDILAQGRVKINKKYTIKIEEFLSENVRFIIKDSIKYFFKMFPELKKRRIV